MSASELLRESWVGVVRSDADVPVADVELVDVRSKATLAIAQVRRPFRLEVGDAVLPVETTATVLEPTTRARGRWRELRDRPEAAFIAHKVGRLWLARLELRSRLVRDGDRVELLGDHVHEAAEAGDAYREVSLPPGRVRARRIRNLDRVEARSWTPRAKGPESDGSQSRPPRARGLWAELLELLKAAVTADFDVD